MSTNEEVKIKLTTEFDAANVTKATQEVEEGMKRVEERFVSSERASQNFENQLVDVGRQSRATAETMVVGAEQTTVYVEANQQNANKLIKVIRNLALADFVAKKANQAHQKGYLDLSGVIKSTESDVISLSSLVISFFKRVGENIKRFVKAAFTGKMAIVTISALVTGSLALIGRKLYKSARRAARALEPLRKTMRQVKFATKSSSKEMKALRGIIEILGTTTKESSTDIAGYIQQFSALELSQKESAEATIAAMNLAKTEGLDSKKVVEALVQAYRGNARHAKELGLSVKGVSKEEMMRGKLVKQIQKRYGETLKSSGRRLRIEIERDKILAQNRKKMAAIWRSSKGIRQLWIAITKKWVQLKGLAPIILKPLAKGFDVFSRAIFNFGSTIKLFFRTLQNILLTTIKGWALLIQEIHLKLPKRLQSDKLDSFLTRFTRKIDESLKNSVEAGKKHIDDIMKPIKFGFVAQEDKDKLSALLGKLSTESDRVIETEKEKKEKVKKEKKKKEKKEKPKKKEETDEDRYYKFLAEMREKVRIGTKNFTFWEFRLEEAKKYYRGIDEYFAYRAQMKERELRLKGDLSVFQRLLRQLQDKNRGMAEYDAYMENTAEIQRQRSGRLTHYEAQLKEMKDNDRGRDEYYAWKDEEELKRKRRKEPTYWELKLKSEKYGPQMRERAREFDLSWVGDQFEKQITIPIDKAVKEFVALYRAVRNFDTASGEMRRKWRRRFKSLTKEILGYFAELPSKIGHAVASIPGKVLESLRTNAESIKSPSEIGKIDTSTTQGKIDAIEAELENINTGIGAAQSITSDVLNMIQPGAGQLFEILTMDPEKVDKFFQVLYEGAVILMDRIAENAGPIIESMAKHAPKVTSAIIRNIPLIIAAIIRQIPNLVVVAVTEIIRQIPLIISSIAQGILAIFKPGGFGGSAATPSTPDGVGSIPASTTETEQAKAEVKKKAAEEEPAPDYSKGPQGSVDASTIGGHVSGVDEATSGGGGGGVLSTIAEGVGNFFGGVTSWISDTFGSTGDGGGGAAPSQATKRKTALEEALEKLYEQLKKESEKNETASKQAAVKQPRIAPITVKGVEHTDQILTSAEAFNPYINEDGAPKPKQPVQIQIQIGDQRLRDVLTNLEETGYPTVVTA